MIPAIIELKSGPVKKWVGYQTAAQRLLLQGALEPGAKSWPISEWKFRTRPECFVKNGHRYFNLKMDQVPGITGILKDQGLITGVEFCSEDARWRGSEVHRMVHLFNIGEFDPSEFDPLLLPYLEAWKGFIRATGFVYMIGETPLVSETQGFGGTMDNFGYFPDDKASSYICRYGLELRPDGSHNLIPFQNHRDESVFLSALTVYNQRLEDGVLKQNIGGTYAD